MTKKIKKEDIEIIQCDTCKTELNEDIWLRFDSDKIYTPVCEECMEKGLNEDGKYYEKTDKRIYLEYKEGE